MGGSLPVVCRGYLGPGDVGTCARIFRRKGDYKKDTAVHTAAPTTGFEEEEGLSVDETSSVGEVLISEDTESSVASVDVKEESEDGDCDGGGGDDGDLFQGLNDAPPLPALKK